MSVGGDKRDRTADLLNAIQALSQLSYTPIFCWRFIGIRLNARHIITDFLLLVNKNFQSKSTKLLPFFALSFPIPPLAFSAE